ncbi:MAG: SGNH/GDSL hydrolase family protein, partial [Cellvibrio sp.]
MLSVPSLAETNDDQTPAQQLVTQKVVEFRFDGATKSKHSISVKPSDAFTDTTGFGYDLNTKPEGNKPFYFSIAVPEGNYRITMELGNKRLASTNTIKAESRRLYLNNEKTRAGKFIIRSFVVNVRNANLKAPENLAPGNLKVSLKSREINTLHWDNKLTLEINGDAPQLCSLRIEAADVPTIFLVGDSTVTDQPFEPAASWGQMLPYFFNDQIAVANHAESGETLKSFISEARLAKVLDHIKAGDYLFIQFGHNDQKKQWPQTYVEANSTYKDYLKVF